MHRNDNPPDLKPPVAKKPNAEIIAHEKKRQIELKVLLYEEKLKERKTPKDDIKKKCKILREQLTEQFDRDPSAMKTNLSETHQKSAAKHAEDAKLRAAFEIKELHVEGAAFEQIGNPGYMAKDTFGKAAAIAEQKAQQKKKEEKEAANPKLPVNYLNGSVYTEAELLEQEERRRNNRRGYRGDHWRPRDRSPRDSSPRDGRSRSRSRGRDNHRGSKGTKRSHSNKRSRSVDKKARRDRSKSPLKKKKDAEPTALALLQGKKKAKKEKKQKSKGKKKESESDSDSSSSSSSDSSSGSSSSSSSSDSD